MAVADPVSDRQKGEILNTFRVLKDTNGMAKTRLRKLSVTGKYYGMEKSNSDKTAFKRPPYYMTAGKKVEKERC